VSFSIPVIFCTAYNEHLLKAFQTNGVAYVLKPYSQEELNEAMQKFEALFRTQPFGKEIFQGFKLLLENKEKYIKSDLL